MAKFMLAIRSLLKRILPLKLHPYPLFESAIRRASGGRVMSGPFAGMFWIEGTVGSYLLPRVLGTYECELHPHLRRLSTASLDAIFVIGAGEGYYVAGLRRLLPGLPIAAFESEERGREIISQVLARNDSGSEISVLGHCSVEALADALASHQSPLVLIDVEGAEQDLLDPAALPKLLAATIIAEVHEVYRPGVEKKLLERFSASHHIERVDPSPRTIDDFPRAWGKIMARLDARYPQWAMEEGRPKGIFWLVMEPRAQVSSR